MAAEDEAPLAARGLNPLPPDGWWASTARRIRTVFPMFPLSVGGLRYAVAKLRASAMA